MVRPQGGRRSIRLVVPPTYRRGTDRDGLPLLVRARRSTDRDDLLEQEMVHRSTDRGVQGEQERAHHSIHRAVHQHQCALAHHSTADHEVEYQRALAHHSTGHAVRHHWATVRRNTVDHVLAHRSETARRSTHHVVPLDGRSNPPVALLHYLVAQDSILAFADSVAHPRVGRFLLLPWTDPGRRSMDTALGPSTYTWGFDRTTPSDNFLHFCYRLHIHSVDSWHRKAHLRTKDHTADHMAAAAAAPAHHMDSLRSADQTVHRNPFAGRTVPVQFALDGRRTSMDSIGPAG